MNRLKKYFMIGLIGFIPINCYALTKNETIYTNLDETGKIVNSSVMNHLFMKDKNIFEDDTELKNILNINGKETFTLDKNIIQWNSKGKDIFYQGTTDKEQPIEVDIEYYLNDKKMNAKDMIGKKGKVKLIFHFKNKEMHEVNFSGMRETVYTPFVVTTGMVLNNQYNDNIEVENGKWVDSGSRSFVIGVATPGLYESFHIQEFQNLNTITVSYDTSKFSFENMYMVATPKIIEEKDLEVFDKLDQLSSNMGTLQSSMNQIENGIQQLKVGSSSLNEGATQIHSHLTTALNSITQLKNGSISLTHGLDTIVDSLNQVKVNLQNKNLTGSITQLQTLKIENNHAISRIVGQTGMNFETLKSFYETNQLQSYNGTDPSLLALKQAYELSYLFSMNNQVIDETVTSMSGISNEVGQLLTTLEAAIIQLQSGFKTISSGLTSLENGVKQLSSGTYSLMNGSHDLYSGVVTLGDGITKVNQEGIHPLYEYSRKIHVYGGKAKEMIHLSKDYHGYATKSADNTMFVYMVKSVK